MTPQERLISGLISDEGFDLQKIQFRALASLLCLLSSRYLATPL